MRLANLIYQYRIMQKLSQRELAHLAYLSRNEISLLERTIGEEGVQVQTLHAIGKVLGISLIELVSAWETDMEPEYEEQPEMREAIP